MTIFTLSRWEYLSVTDGLSLGEIWARVTGFINEDTDGVWDAGVQTVDDALQLLLQPWCLEEVLLRETHRQRWIISCSSHRLLCKVCPDT